MTRSLTVGEIVRTRLVRIEAFTADDGFAAAFTQAVGIAPPKPLCAAAAPRGAVLWAEPKAWLAEGDAAALQSALSGVAAVADVSGAWRAIPVTGHDWRTLLSIDGWFDAESPSFGVGALAATLMHHAPVMVQVTAETTITVYTQPSFAQDLQTSLRKAAKRLSI